MDVLDIMDKIDNEQSYLKKQHSIVLQESIHNPSISSPPSPLATITTSLPSAYSSPTHEFSFTVSLQSPAAIELTPADDIFLHGHLLPFYIPISPRSSTNSMDSFTLPKNLLYDTTNPIGNHQTNFSYSNKINPNTSNQNQHKSKSFSIFRIPKWKNKERNSKKPLKLDLRQLIKRYTKMVRPFLSFPKCRRSNREFSQKSYSFSGSKPPEMNKGILFASGSVSPIKSTTNESTMEELHAAIQAAIAHCKNSIDMEDKIKSQIN